MSFVMRFEVFMEWSSSLWHRVAICQDTNVPLHFRHAILKSLQSWEPGHFIKTRYMLLPIPSQTHSTRRRPLSHRYHLASTVHVRTLEFVSLEKNHILSGRAHSTDAKSIYPATDLIFFHEITAVRFPKVEHSADSCFEIKGCVSGCSFGTNDPVTVVLNFNLYTPIFLCI